MCALIILINISICDHLYLYQAKQQLLLVSPALVHRHGGPSISCLCFCSLQLQQWEIWPPPTAIYLLNCWISVSELLVCATGETLSTRIQGLCTVSFASSFIGSPHFQRYLGHRLSPSPWEVVVSHICNTVRFFYHSLHSITGSSCLTVNFWLNLHTFRFIFVL